jgi:hypothetical protein
MAAHINQTIRITRSRISDLGGRFERGCLCHEHAGRVARDAATALVTLRARSLSERRLGMRQRMVLTSRSQFHPLGPCLPVFAKPDFADISLPCNKFDRSM